MNEDNYTDFRVGDYVTMSGRYIPGLGSFSRGVIGRIDKYSMTPQDVLVIAYNKGMPLPLPCVKSSIKVVNMPIEEKRGLDSVFSIFNEMSVAVGAI